MPSPYSRDEPMIHVRNLTRRFGDLTAVDDVSFSVPDGVITGFVGGNGAGKTTTMRMIMGLLAIDAGEVRWGDAPITTEQQRTIGYMPEERGLYPKQSILDQLVYFGVLSGMSSTDAKRSVMEYLERFGLADRADDRVEKLSLGNQQRVQIIAALVHRPQALVLDEPFSGLDPVAVDQMVELLRGQTARGVHVLFSSHQLDLVERLSDRVVILARGRVVADGEVMELRERGGVRHHLVTDADVGWLASSADVASFDRSDDGAIVRLGGDQGADQRLLAEAVSRGPVHQFVRVVPNLTDIYREVSE